MLTVVIGAVCLLGDLFPFVMDAVPAEGVADVSALLPAPAGKDGFVRRAGAHFETDAGRIRFNGMNLTGSANFPKREQAVRLAKGLSRRGINCVRLHYMDADYGNFMQPKERGFCELDGTLRPDLFDRLDFLVSEFKRRGIYVVDKVGEDGMRQIATRGADWGTGPVLSEGIPLKVTFAKAEKVRCWALDPSGQRWAELAVVGNQVVTSADDKTVWYEIEIQKK